MSASEAAEARNRNKSREALKRQYRIWLRVERGNKKTTVSDMLKWTDHFLDWLEKRSLSLDDVSQEVVDEYIMECKDHYSHNSMVPITSNLKKLLVYWQGMELRR